MKKLITDHLEKYALSRRLLKICYVGYNTVKFWIVPEVYLVKKRFYRHHSRYPNLDKPVDFAEKITWLKLFDRKPIQSLCADKLRVRSFVSEKIGSEHLVPLIATYDSVEKFTLSELDKNQTVIVKATHDSKGGYKVDLSSEYDETKLKLNLYKRFLRNHYYATNEWQYLHIEPKIIVEKFLTNNGSPVDDFKLYCCNGKVLLIQHDTSREVNHRQNFYDVNWQPHNIRFVAEPGEQINPPEKLIDMINYAEILAAEFIFSRIDFYIVDSHLYFGEITFHPESGYQSFRPEIWDRKISEAINLNEALC